MLGVSVDRATGGERYLTRSRRQITSHRCVCCTRNNQIDLLEKYARPTGTRKILIHRTLDSCKKREAKTYNRKR